MPSALRERLKGITADQLRATGGADGARQHVSLGATAPAKRPCERSAVCTSSCSGTGRFSPTAGLSTLRLAQMTKVTEEQAVFRSHIDGSLVHLSPERAVAIQEALGSDVAMVLDHVVALPATDEVIDDAMERTMRWAVRCQKAAARADQAQFAIVSRGLGSGATGACAERLADWTFPAMRSAG